MHNLDQIRARNALAAAQLPFHGDNEGEVVKKIPALIRENGLLAAAAFALEKKGGHERVFEAIIAHLADKDVGKLAQSCSLAGFVEWLAGSEKPADPVAVAGSAAEAGFVEWLAGSEKATSARLRDVTAESMAYLGYLRRFARK